MIEVTDTLAIPEHEVTYTFSRSAGPGGQHVNKVSTRVTLLFDVAHSRSLSDRQRARIRGRLATRINRGGVLRVVCQKHRSQSANREEARERFAGLLREALRERPRRKKAGVPRSVVERRLEQKRRRSGLKRERSKRYDPED
jgi:ribosome-associated protein